MWEAVVTGLIAFTGALAFVLRLEGKVKLIEEVNKKQDEGLSDLIEAKFEATDYRLERIERALNGYIRDHGHPR